MSKKKSAKKKSAKKKLVRLTQEQQLAHLEARFGFDMKGVDVTLPMTFNEVEAYFGQECKDFNHLCGCCLAWQQWQLAGKVTVRVDREEIINLLNK
jgi:hypothetical protein